MYAVYNEYLFWLVFNVDADLEERATWSPYVEYATRFVSETEARETLKRYDIRVDATFLRVS